MSKAKRIFFTTHLMEWYRADRRPLPWKDEKDPYLIWLSEIILQQTRAEQGRPYFERFKTNYPKVEHLAAAPEDEVMKRWEGLGYYSRARNLHAAAKFIADELAGQFPDTYAGIRSLKGVGPYTAAAIASFAFALPHAVVDGNVFRVLARFFGITTPVDTTSGKKKFGELAQSLLDETQPGRYNQAIMDFGAIQCLPKKPLCGSCPLASACDARLQDRIPYLPVKGKKPERRTRYFHYLLLNVEDRIAIRKRSGKDIWQNLYDFPLIEADRPLEHREQVTGSTYWQENMLPLAPVVESVSPPYKQELTHQKIIAFFWEVRLKNEPATNRPAWKWTNRKNLGKFAFPKIIDLYLRDKSLYLKLH